LYIAYVWCSYNVKFNRFHVIFVILVSLLILPILLTDSAKAALVPDWVKNIAKLYGDGVTTESDFLNAIQYLIESGIIVIPEPEKEIMDDDSNIPLTAQITMPNGNAEQSNTGFYIPLHLQVKLGTTVIWINDDNVLHTVQSQDLEGNPNGLFNSNVLDTGERFAFKFDESGFYNYFCTLHPWRVGQVTVS
jgi:plastocyanin